MSGQEHIALATMLIPQGAYFRPKGVDPRHDSPLLVLATHLLDHAEFLNFAEDSQLATRHRNVALKLFSAYKAAAALNTYKSALDVPLEDLFSLFSLDVSLLEINALYPNPSDNGIPAAALTALTTIVESETYAQAAKDTAVSIAKTTANRHASVVGGEALTWLTALCDGASLGGATEAAVNLLNTSPSEGTLAEIARGTAAAALLSDLPETGPRMHHYVHEQMMATANNGSPLSHVQEDCFNTEGHLHASRATLEKMANTMIITGNCLREIAQQYDPQYEQEDRAYYTARATEAANLGTAMRAGLRGMMVSCTPLSPLSHAADFEAMLSLDRILTEAVTFMQNDEHFPEPLAGVTRGDNITAHWNEIRLPANRQSTVEALEKCDDSLGFLNTMVQHNTCEASFSLINPHAEHLPEKLRAQWHRANTGDNAHTFATTAIEALEHLAARGGVDPEMADSARELLGVFALMQNATPNATGLPAAKPRPSVSPHFKVVHVQKDEDLLPPTTPDGRTLNWYGTNSIPPDTAALN